MSKLYGTSRIWLTLFSLVVVFLVTAYPQDNFERLFYYVDDKPSYQSFVSHAGEIDVVAPAVYSVDENGVVWGEIDRRVLEVAARDGVKVVPLVHNPGFDQEMVHGLLADSTARRRAIGALLELCREHGFAGFQFDFENVHIDDRDAFTRFYREAARAFHAAKLEISVAVVHRPGSLPGPSSYFRWLFTNWRAAYDVEALAEIGDFVSVMTYSQHTRRTPPGPNAGLPWVLRNLEYFLERAPAAKLSLGIPLGSQHWHIVHDDQQYHANARSWSDNLDYEWAMGMAERHGAKVLWDDTQKVPYTVFENGGLFEYIYFEDVRSFSAKLDLVKEHRLRGFSAWVLGREDPKVWELLKRSSGR